MTQIDQSTPFADEVVMLREIKRFLEVASELKAEPGLKTGCCFFLGLLSQHRTACLYDAKST